ncbi:TPA: phosphonoacetaldehyde hydrolase, partial [Enterococcus faecium]|nr:phosphonoacetaldehyde hydrolase [Enterococcus faecium]HAP6158554.1 phosphonoacetaldehyde hydrolase [Enterococcus faecium]
NMQYFKNKSVDEVIKVGDTVSDIQEGKNAGVLTVGVIEGSSLMGISYDEYQKLEMGKKIV